MRKTKAIELLGGSVTLAAKAIGISYQAVHKWPDDLTPEIVDRVHGFLARKLLPPDVLGLDGPASAATQQQAHEAANQEARDAA